MSVSERTMPADPRSKINTLAAETPPLEPPPLFDRLRGALLEDLSLHGDVTSQALIPENKMAGGFFLAKADGVVCGVKLLPLIFQMAEQLVSSQAAGRAWDLDDAQDAARTGQAHWDQVQKLRDEVESEQIRVTPKKKDGDRVTKGDHIAEISGNARAILAGERVALNLLSHLSGVATQTAAYVAKTSGTRAKILDTRKTLPLWRDLQKYAVKCGGGENHRRDLGQMILIKDNHLMLWGQNDPAGAVRAAQARFPEIEIEIEVTNLDALRRVCESSNPQMILLDNFSCDQLREAVAWCDRFFIGENGALAKNPDARRPLLECSGGVTLEKISEISRTNVDRISVGALTHSVTALDISLEILEKN